MKKYSCSHLENLPKAEISEKIGRCYSLYLYRLNKRALFCDFCPIHFCQRKIWFCTACFASCCPYQIEDHILKHAKETNHFLYADFSSNILTCTICQKPVLALRTYSSSMGNIYINHKVIPLESMCPVPASSIGKEVPDFLSELFSSPSGNVEKGFLMNHNTSGGLTGLTNCGNSCYMNSTLQVLMHCPKLMRIILRLSELQHLYSAQPRTGLLLNFAALCGAVWSGRYSVINPREVFFGVWKLTPHFKGYDQQDAHEFLGLFLLYLMENLSFEEENTESFETEGFLDNLIYGLRLRLQLFAKKDSLVLPPFDLSANLTLSEEEDPTESMRSASTVFKSQFLASVESYLAWLSQKAFRKPHRVFPQKTDSSIRPLFWGVITQKIVCQQCRSVSTNEEEFLELALEVKTASNIAKKTNVSFLSFQNLKEILGIGESVSLRALVKYSLKSEKLEGEHAYFCATCMAEMPAVRTNIIKKFPEILIFHLKRFAHSNISGSSKIHTKVDFPLENLKLKSCYSVENPKKMKKQSFDKKASLPANKPESVPAAKAETAVFDLIGLVVHKGNLNSGHYYSVCKHPWTNEWFEFNDKRVISLSAAEVGTYNPYLIFYSLKSHSLEDKAAALKNRPYMLSQFGWKSEQLESVEVEKLWVAKLEDVVGELEIVKTTTICKHGFDLKIKNENKTIKVPLKTYKKLEELFGVKTRKKLGVCSLCRIEKLEFERELELESLSEYIEMFAGASKFGVVHQEWLNSWQRFLYNETENKPPKLKEEQLRLFDCSKPVDRKKLAFVDYGVYKHLKHFYLNKNC